MCRSKDAAPSIHQKLELQMCFEVFDGWYTLCDLGRLSRPVCVTCLGATPRLMRAGWRSRATLKTTTTRRNCSPHVCEEG